MLAQDTGVQWGRAIEKTGETRARFVHWAMWRPTPGGTPMRHANRLLKQKRVGRLVYLLLFQSHEAPFRLPSRCSCLPGQFSPRIPRPPALALAAAVLPAAAAEGEE